MAPMHHRSSWLKQKNKGHKSTHRSKRAVNLINGGKIQTFRGGRSRAGSTISGVAKQGKKGRLNQAQMMRKKKKDALFNRRRMGGLSASITGSLAGQHTGHSAPRLIGVIPLNDHADPNSFAEMITGESAHEWIPGQPKTFVNIENKFRGSVVVAERSSLGVLDVAKCADIICFILPVGKVEGNTGGTKFGALDQYLENAIDVKGRTFITLAKNQGLPTVVGVVQNLETVPQKHQSAVKRQATLFFQEEFGPNTKLIDGGSANAAMTDESMTSRRSMNNVKQALRTLMDARLKCVTYRSERSYMIADATDFKEDTSNNSGTLRIQGYLRGKPLSIHQLIHIPGHGSFQMKQIESVPDPKPLKKRHRKQKEADSGTEMLLVADPTKLQSLKEEGEPDLMMGEQTWPTAEEMGEASTGSKENDTTEA
eukprot:CAMPEP_0184013992 /NCGR_PEP_ID=MMETSP0954-20121128/5358_1 /TAXON_ID=627963 /ORGANISM="Aplanochytrium sp, Strain PBS07" /LENGTH=424 /DNA_ID=CAMNT_0026294317 /DNA_START=56 /DNA_END=1327 /DNA_ORIENTATION=-